MPEDDLGSFGKTYEKLPTVESVELNSVQGGKVEKDELVQGYKFGTKTKETWDDGRPLMTPVITVVQDNGERGVIWARGNLYTVIKEALLADGKGALKPGDDLRFYLRDYSDTGKGNPAHLYAAKITRAAADSFAVAGETVDEPPF